MWLYDKKEIKNITRPSPPQGRISSLCQREIFFDKMNSVYEVYRFPERKSMFPMIKNPQASRLRVLCVWKDVSRLGLYITPVISSQASLQVTIRAPEWTGDRRGKTVE